MFDSRDRQKICNAKVLTIVKLFLSLLNVKTCQSDISLGISLHKITMPNVVRISFIIALQTKSYLHYIISCQIKSSL